MSYQLFKAELRNKVYKQHDSLNKFPSSFAAAYNNLVMRHFDTLTGGGKLVRISAGRPILQQSIYAQLMINRKSPAEVNFFNQIAPFIKIYWAGQQIIGPTGIVTITYPGEFIGPYLKQNQNINIFINTLVGVISTHIMTLTGMYTNAYTGITTPWSGALLRTTP